MNRLTTIKKYEKALDITLFCIKYNTKTNLLKIRKELKINKNFINALFQLEIIKNNGTGRGSRYVLLKNYTPELALQVLNFSNEISKNKKKSIIEKPILIANPKKTFSERFFNLFKF